MKSYSVKNIEAVMNEAKATGACYIGNIETGTLTIRGIKKIEKYMQENDLIGKLLIMLGQYYTDHNIDGDMYIVSAM